MAREDLVKVPSIILGSRLRAKRKGLRLSQHQLGGEDFSPSYVSAVERGKIRPSLKALYILADRLGEPVIYFLQDEGATRTGDMLEEAVASAKIDIVQGRPGEAIKKLQSLSLQGHSPETQANVHLSLGQAYIAHHQPGHAGSALQEAMRLADSAGDQLLAAYARLYQGVAYYQQHKAGLALESHRRCLQAITDGAIKDLGFSLRVYLHLGEDLLALGQEKDALQYYDAAMKTADEAADLRTLAATLWDISASYERANDLFQARLYAQKSIGVLESLQMLSVAASMHNTYATVLSGVGQKDRAETVFREAQTMAQHIGDDSVAATATIRLGELAGEKQDYATAEQLISAGVERASALGNELVASQGLLSLAQVYAAQSRREDAESQFQSAIARLESAGAPDAVSKAYFRYGQALVSWGESAKGAEYMEKAYLQTHKA